MGMGWSLGLKLSRVDVMMMTQRQQGGVKVMSFVRGETHERGWIVHVQE